MGLFKILKKKGQGNIRHLQGIKKMTKLNITKAEQFYNKNQYVLRDGKGIIFQSYNSIIAVYNYDDKTLTLGKDWDYSTTTSKHLYLFIDDYVDTLTDEGYLLSSEIRSTSNKRKLINKYIEKGIINYEEDLV